MFTKLSVGKKLTISFGVVVVLLGVVALWAVVGIGGIVGNAQEVIAGNKLRGEMVQREVDHLNWVNSLNDFLSDNSIKELKVTTDPKKCGLGKFLYGEGRKNAERLVPELRIEYQELEKVHIALHNSAKEIEEHYFPADKTLYGFLSEKEADHLAWVNNVYDFLHNKKEELNVITDDTKCGLGRFISGKMGNALAAQKDYREAFVQLKEHHHKLHKSATDIMGVWNNRNSASIALAEKIFREQSLQALMGCQASIKELKEQAKKDEAGYDKAHELFLTKSKPALRTAQGLLNSINKKISEKVMTDEEMIQQAATTKVAVIVISVLATLLAMILAFIITKAIVKPINVIIQGLTQGSDQVASAADQVSASSQSMAEGASEQASSVEEISATLEEMAAMTKETARSAGEVNEIAARVGEATRSGQVSMKNMVGVVKGIKKSSDETAKIVKNINEIAFQTNLLALNAAVEAARAGDAGKGFAVVAEEVRNLAQRSASAANDTAELIEQSQKSADNGVVASEDVEKILNEIAGQIEEVTGLIAGMAKASAEQSVGIGQVNEAVNQMDGVIQATASISEESASASEELSAQSALLQDMVCDLVKVINGSNCKKRSVVQKQYTALPQQVISHGGKTMYSNVGTIDRPVSIEVL